MLSALEALLAVVGIQPVLFRDDPYVGFTSRIPLFVQQTNDQGNRTYVTAPNKQRWFNRQSFPAEKPTGAFRIFCVGGSTTYGRPYADSTSFCGWLREFLPEADNSKTWEVVNAGGISYASYRVANLMEELIRYEPDLFIVYTGHNEFLENRTYDRLIATPSSLREAGAVLSHTRIYAAMQAAFRKATGEPSQAPSSATLNAEVTTILDESVGPKDYHRDDAFRQQVLDHYRFNLERIIEIAHSADARVILVTPASNLLDCTPFKSEHREGLATTELETWNEYCDLARKRLTECRWEEAVGLLDRALAIDDRYAQLHYLRGQALQHLGRHDEAYQALSCARDEDVCPLRAIGPIHDIVVQVAAESRVPLVDFATMTETHSPDGIPGARLFLDHVHPTIDGHRQLALELVDAMARSGCVETGEEWNANTIERVTAEVEARLDHRAQAEALRNLSKVLAWAGKYGEARQLNQKAAALAPDDALVYYQFGVCAQGEGNLVEAAKHYRRAIELQPGCVEAHNNLGTVLEQQGNLSEAVEHFRTAVALHEEDDKAHFNLGKALLCLGSPEAALQHLNRVVALRPLDAEAHVTLASAQVRLGRTADALASVKKAAELQPDNPDTINKLGSLQAAEGDHESAERSYRRALEIDPTHAGSMENLAWLLATSCDSRIRRPAEALELAQRVCRMNEREDPATLDVLAAAQAAAGDYSDAAATARRAVRLADSQGRSDMAQAIRARLSHFARHTPYVEESAALR